MARGGEDAWVAPLFAVSYASNLTRMQNLHMYISTSNPSTVLLYQYSSVDTSAACCVWSKVYLQSRPGRPMKEEDVVLNLLSLFS